ncbi:hypothetical protein BW730_00020 [Tessaracoccus aquimaris]|uniref:HTH merR-type domain-containing protein n=1 Tax=Tessaracoccus aquimaris TaxID=1332264 RepID=A0A1Q2CJB9_9ACTN|nr:HEAT repeat domain-containing protein [Tessaracoccus aquimaris]AQP46202.1 hypothetical protein BW730_00020 [Tessaracoccus aquimaris]
MDDWLRIGEVARRTGLTHRTLRHYDEIGLLQPSGRTDVDYRLYSRADLDRLFSIQQLKALGLSLTEVAAALDEGVDAAELLGRHAEVVEARIAEERELLATLRRLQAAADTGWDEVLGAIELTQRLRHPDASVRFRTTLTDAPRAPVDVLIELLSDPADGVREGATWAVAQRRDVRPELVERMLHGDQRTRHSLAHTLGKLRDPEGVAALAVLLADQDEAVAAKAAFALGQVGGVPAAEALVAGLGDARELVRDESGSALARTPEGIPLLILALRDASATVREEAADALGQAASVVSVPALIATLDDDVEAVRFAALVALGQVDDERAGRAIGEAVDSPDVRTRLVARRLVADAQAR